MAKGHNGVDMIGVAFAVLRDGPLSYSDFVASLERQLKRMRSSRQVNRCSTAGAQVLRQQLVRGRTPVVVIEERLYRLNHQHPEIIELLRGAVTA